MRTGTRRWALWWGWKPPHSLPAEELREEVLFLCGLTGAGIQLAVAALRKAGLYIPYKASLTPTNKDWTVRQLFSEIYQEHQAMHSGQERVHTEE